MRRCTRPFVRVTALAVLVLLSAATGCAAAKPKQAVMFPPPPEKGRIKWVRSFRTEDEITHSFWRKLWKVLVPHDSSSAIVAPSGLALSPDETKLYVALPHRSRVVAVDLEAGTFSSIGTGSKGTLARPIGVAVDAGGNVFVSDKGASAIFVFAPDGTVLRSFGREKLSGPTGIAIDRRRQVVYVVNDASTQEGRSTVEVFSAAGQHLRTMGGGRSDSEGMFNFPRSVSVSPSGELYVVDMLNFRIQVFGPDGNIVRSFGQAGTGFPGHFDKIQSVAFDTFNNVYVADVMQGIHILNDRAQPLMVFGPGVTRAPDAVVINSKNHIYVADLTHAIHEFELVNTTRADSYLPPPKPAAAPATGAPPASTPASADRAGATQDVE